MRKSSFTLQKRFRAKKIAIVLIACIGTIGLFHKDAVDTCFSNKIRVCINHIEVYFASSLDWCSNFLNDVRWLFSNEFSRKLVNLKNDNAQLQYKINELRHLKEENEQLRKLLNIEASATKSVVTAKVLTLFANDFSRSCLVNAGADKQVSLNDTVYNNDGLIGRVIEVGNVWSRVLLITDAGANIPVKIGNRSVNAIVSGNNGRYLRVAIVHEDITLEPGQKVVTSGYGNVFDDNIAVGKVVEQNGSLVVVPYVDFSSIKYVNIVKKHANDR